MASTVDGTDAPASQPTGEPNDQSDDQSGEYSRRKFMETAAAASAAGATALAGCSSNSGSGDGGTDGNGEQDFLWWTMRGYIPAETKAIKDAAKGYEDAADENINVTTEVVVWDQVFQEWSASIEGRSMPNVSEMACEHAADFGNRGAARPNTELFNEYDDWYDTISKWGQFDGDFWGMPWFMELRTSHVNMNLLEEAGVSKPPETWAELVETGQAVSENTDASGFTTPGATDFPTGQNQTAITHQSGGSFYGYSDDQFSVEIDSPASLFAHLWTLSLREQWDIAPGGWGGIDSTSGEELYRAKRTAIAHLPTDLARSLIDPQEGVVDGNEELAEATELTPMPKGPNGKRQSFMGGSCMTTFKENVTRHNIDDKISLGFLDYMTQPDQLNKYFPVSAPNFLPVRSGQEEMELFTDNPTEIPDSWLDARLEQAPNAVRYGVTGAGRVAPFLGSVEGSTTGYSTAISGMIGSETDPKKAIRGMADKARSAINSADYIDYELETPEEPSLDDAPDEVQPWITGDGVPKIYNPYE
ncbi:ABC transporter substrate-binding protein [Halogeometricum pallidum JCM 14848]|uniref:ABC transporter substrate-binding protein n=1 Tax=Halogeometricum pallidum JCM 14848 TaxID=1227487 RepID=M0DCN0_HALPD|nr:extracellular solute-binding protein [Halogeometricum pallidum]ELZ32487.1 ABC transporter substrate-binding protein [Halogeometricum pallidum JCM 14848]